MFSENENLGILMSLSISPVKSNETKFFYIFAGKLVSKNFSEQQKIENDKLEEQ